MATPAQPTPEQVRALVPGERVFHHATPDGLWRVVELVTGRYQVQRWNTAVLGEPRYTVVWLTKAAAKTQGTHTSYATLAGARSALRNYVRHEH